MTFTPPLLSEHLQMAVKLRMVFISKTQDKSVLTAFPVAENLMCQSFVLTPEVE